VPAAFELLLTASSREEGRAAYDSMLFAIGNNHAGCLYPAAVPAVPLIARVALEYEGWQRWAAVEVLIECVVFDVDREEFVEASGSVVHVKNAIVAVVGQMRDELQQMACSRDADPVAISAQQLLEQLEDLL
jgi:hypothetical protein